MKTTKILKRLAVSGLALGALGLTAGLAMAKDFYLCAKPVTKTIAGEQVPMWGFALDDDNNLANGCTNAATVPGPNLSLGAGTGAFATTFNIHLRNDLPESVSLVIDGLPKAMAPVFFADNHVPPRMRMSSLDAVVPPGMTGIYTYTNVPAGTWLYGSGTHMQVHRPMGLYGAAFKTSPGTKQAYAGVGFDRSAKLLYSEVDPDLNNAVAPLVGTPTYGTAPWTSTFNYNPKYHLINGSLHEANLGCIFNATPLNVGETALLRMLNAGSGYKTAQFLNTHVDEVAEGGLKLSYPRNLYSVKLDAGGTKDVIVTPTSGGNIPFIDGFGGNSVNQTGNPAQASRGAQWCVAVAAAAGAPSAMNDSAPTTEGGSTSGNVLGNDTGAPFTSVTLISGPAQASAFNFVETAGATQGDYTYTHNGSETTADAFTYQIVNANGTSQATVNITVTPVNDPPVANPDTATTDDANPVTIAVLDNDTDVDIPADTLTVTGVVVTSGAGSASTDGTTVTYTPVSGSPGAVVLTYTLFDGTDSVPGTVNVTVTAFVNAAPITVADFPAATRNDLVEADLLLTTTGTTTFNILGNDSDDGVTITPAVAEADFDDRQGGPLNNGEVRILGKRYKIAGVNQNHNPAANGKNYPVKITKKGGIVAYDGLGNVVYKPPRFFVGTDVFNYRLMDKDGALSAKAKVKITVTAP